jgi:hypothetical protein
MGQKLSAESRSWKQQIGAAASRSGSGQKQHQEEAALDRSSIRKEQQAGAGAYRISRW